MKNIKFLNQSRFPSLWNLFQILIGGTTDKRRIYKSMHANIGSRVLEVGCSTGNTAIAFKDVPMLDYVGLDIDLNAIQQAKRLYKNSTSFQFVCEDLRTYAQLNIAPFDFILFGNIAHHISEAMLIELLNASVKLMHKDSRLVVIDPLLPSTQDPLLVQFYANKLEKGEYLRTWSETEKILNHLNNLQVMQASQIDVGATPLSWPLCARFSSYTLRLK